MRFAAVAVLLAASAFAAAARAQELPLRETYPSDDFVVREAMVPMRDGVKLYTLILTPKRASSASLPILLERTPYDATRALGGRPTTRLEVSQESGYAGGGTRSRAPSGTFGPRSSSRRGTDSLGGQGRPPIRRSSAYHAARCPITSTVC